jgi:deoxycytidylate deaminase
MSKEIKLHPKHGLNPTIAKCCICGGDKNEIALLGAAHKGEAPKSMVIDMIPCDTCHKQYLTEGIMCVETDAGEDTPRKDAKFTGNFVVLRESAFREFFKAEVPSSRMAHLTARSFDILTTALHRAEALQDGN